MAESAIVLIGKKPLLNYVLAASIPLNEGRKVVLKARGRAISRAVDITEMLRRRFVKDAVIESISIGSEEGKAGNDNRPRTVSTIEITIAPPKPSE